MTDTILDLMDGVGDIIEMSVKAYQKSKAKKNNNTQNVQIEEKHVQETSTKEKEVSRRRLEVPKKMPKKKTSSNQKEVQILHGIARNKLQEGIIMAEVLGQPRCKRRHTRPRRR